MDIKNIFNEVDTIEGWFTEWECRAILPYLPAEGLIMELGTFHGRSTMFFSLAAPHCQIITIDLCEQYDVKDKIPRSADKAVLDRPNVTQIKGDCLSIAGEFDTYHKSIDFLFIDTRHTFEDTLANLNAWTGYVVHNGYVALHDYHDGFPGVKQAVDEFMKNNPDYSRIETGLGIGLLKKL